MTINETVKEERNIIDSMEETLKIYWDMNTSDQMWMEFYQPV